MTGPTLNEYANAMFRHEHLHDDWIARCADYLRRAFGESLEGKSVVDYGFGRGNWSLAFLRAGARRVISIDAAEDNVARFHRYCRDKDVPGVEIVHGNILVEPIAAAADIVWLYGVLHHIDAAETFVARLAALGPSPDALFYIYAYERGSLRQFIVETCRRFVRYTSEEAFRRDSLFLSRPARMRARDDLVAPHVRYYGTRELHDLLKSENLRPIQVRQDCLSSSASKSTGGAAEFRPHEWLCGRDASERPVPPDPEMPFARDIPVLQAMADAILALPPDRAELRRIGLGLFNTHFSALAAATRTEKALVEDFLYLLYVLLAKDADLGELAESHPCVDLALAGMTGRRRPLRALKREPTVLARWLPKNRPRV